MILYKATIVTKIKISMPLKDADELVDCLAVSKTQLEVWSGHSQGDLGAAASPDCTSFSALAS